MPVYKDQLQKEISLTALPQRIVSLVPSQTELLYDLGLDDKVIGITKFCVHPQRWFREKISIGGTKNIAIEKVKSLHPDLIIANKEENIKEQVEELQTIAPVYTSDISNLDDALDMIRKISEITGTTIKANNIIHQIKTSLNGLPAMSNLSTAYLIWRNPYMTVGGDTFINDMLKRCGFANVFENERRYPETNIEELIQRKPALILLSSEPYPFKEKHLQEIQVQIPSSKVILADGEMFSWYGSRLLYAAEYFKNLLKSLN